MIFNFKIILNLVKRIVIIKKSQFFTTTNVKCTKNILLKIFHFYAITKLNNAINFYSNEYKIVTIIFQVII